MKPLQIGIAVIVNHGRILTCRRPPGSHLGGMLEFPGGKVRPGESPAGCAVRETAEEVGLAVRPVRLLATVPWAYPGRFVELHFWLCELAEDSAPTGRGRCQWALPQDLRDEDFPPANASLLARLRSGQW